VTTGGAIGEHIPQRKSAGGSKLCLKNKRGVFLLFGTQTQNSKAKRRRVGAELYFFLSFLSFPFVLFSPLYISISLFLFLPFRAG